MKLMNDENGSNNWLGFSLESPHMRIEGGHNSNNNNSNGCSPVDPHQQQFINHSEDTTTATTHSSEVAPTNFYLPSSSTSSSSHHLNMSSYGVVAENGDFHSPLSVVMPLKSDGSLCIMEALSASHPRVVMSSNSSPKLEDFLGSGATMGGGHSRDHSSSSSMVLSLDHAFYNQDPFIARQQPYHHQQQQHHQYYYYYPGLNNNSNIALYETEVPPNIRQQPQLPHGLVSSENEIPCLKTWNLEQQHNHAALQLKVNSNNNHNVNTTSMVEESGARMGGGGDFQSLSLSMSPGSQSSSCVTAPSHISATNTNASHEGVIVAAMENSKKRGPEKMLQKQTVHRKSIDTFGQRTSQYRGVTRHRWTGRYEAHLWDNSCKKEGQTRKGRQVYLGGYDMEEKAARSYDLAALKYWGPSTHINFALENYHQELEEMKNMSRQEYVAHLRRKSSGFSRGASIYRGVTRHHQHGRWQARIGRVAGNKDLYLGTFSTQEEAAEAYDIAAIKFRGVNAVTNFDITRYDVEKIMASNTLPTGDIARRNKDEKPQVIADDIIGNASDWKMVLQNQGHQETVVINEASITMNNAGNYQNPPFVALHDLIGLDSSQTVVDESRATVTQHFSNPSSLVTSLSNSREASPDKIGGHILFSKPSSNNAFATNVHSWIPTAQLRPALPLTTAHLPVFAAWNDA